MKKDLVCQWNLTKKYGVLVPFRVEVNYHEFSCGQKVVRCVSMA